MGIFSSVALGTKIMEMYVLLAMAVYQTGAWRMVATTGDGQRKSAEKGWYRRAVLQRNRK